MNTGERTCNTNVTFLSATCVNLVNLNSSLFISFVCVSCAELAPRPRYLHLLVWEHQSSPPGCVINLSFFSFWRRTWSTPPETCHGHFVLWTTKSSYISPSECQLFVCFQLQPHRTEGPSKWMQYDGALEPTMVNCATLSFKHCSLNWMHFFLWLKHFLSDLPLTGPLYSTVVLKDVWLNTRSTGILRSVYPWIFTTVARGREK